MTMPPKRNNQTGIQDDKSTERRNMSLTLGKTAVSTSSSTSPSSSSVKRNTNIVDVVSNIVDNATITKKIIANIIHTPNDWLEIIHDECRQEKA
jgi:hypothetical protein